MWGKEVIKLLLQRVGENHIEKQSRSAGGAEALGEACPHVFKVGPVSREVCRYGVSRELE